MTELPSTHGSCPALLVETTTSIAKKIAGAHTSPTKVVEVHPLVLLSVLDHHTRRPEGAGRVIGTLLGTKDGDRVEITNCFAVPHAERGDEVAIGKDFNRQMMALHSRANRKERVVGWYATALPPDDEATESDDAPAAVKQSVRVADTSSLIHEFYAAECEDDPVHVVLDTSLDQDDVGLKAYKCVPVRIKGEPLANLFHEIRLVLRANEGERVCLDDMIRKQEISIGEGNEGKDNDAPPEKHDPDDTAELRDSMERLHSMLEIAFEYVDGVVEGTTPPDDAVGRRIADTLSSIPKIRPDVFDKMFNDSLQDLLMVTYLSNLTRTQLTIAEKLNAALHL